MQLDARAPACPTPQHALRGRFSGEREMAHLMKQKFRFTVDSLPGDTFSVVNFEGDEGLSQLFEFSITLVSEEKNIEMTEVVESSASFTILREKGNVRFPGIVKYCEQLNNFNKYYFYRVVLVPKLWWLTLTHHNQVFLDKTVPQILTAVLKDGGVTSNDFELRLQHSYPTWEYVCQYNESHYDFFARWLEREGMYYFFEDTPSGGKMVVTDTKISHTEMEQGKEAYYAPPSGLEPPDKEEIISSFICRQQTIPSTVKLKDYNYRTPSLDLACKAKVADHGRGEFYMYGDHFRTKSEGENLAAVRAEEILCRERRFYADGTVPFLRPGFTFKLKNHYRETYNQEYLTVSIHHRGSQAAYLVSGVMLNLSEEERRMHYENSFTAISASVQFRPDRLTEKPRLHGTLNAKIDAQGSGQYAELDDQGRYKVLLPFDVSGRAEGKGSAWIRMAQPYAGPDQGMQFPLRKDAEVLLTFIDGDPDRPIIAAAVPNPDTKSPVTDTNASMSKISTASGNVFHLEDKEGSERILMHSPKQDTFIRIGAENDPAPAGPPPDESFWSNDGIKLYTGKALTIKAATSHTITLGETTSMTGGNANAVVVGLDTKTVLLARLDVTLGGRTNIMAPAIIDIVGGVKFAVGGQRTVAWGSVAKAAAAKQAAVGATILALGQTTTALGQRLDATGQTTTALGNRLDAIGQRTLALGQRTDALGQRVEATGQTTTALGQRVDALGQRTTALGQDTMALGQRVTTLGQETRAIGQQTTVLAQKTETATNIAVISALISLL